jgi:hypothetical protein
MPDEQTPAQRTTPVRGRDFVRARALMYGFEVMQSQREKLSAFEAFQRGVEAYEDYLAAYDRRYRPAAMEMK